MKKTILSLLILLPQLLQAQTITFLDKNNEPIPAVVVRGNNNNFLSNDEGILKLNLSSPQDMVASHISYDSKSFRVNPGDNIQVFLDRMEFSLSEVVVSSFETERPLLQQAAAVHKVPYSDLLRFNETSMVNAFNTRPGIKVEERAPASYRISIRGSSLRAPFGVRNVKVYWNEIPFTAPDGTTPLNILDLTNLGNTEIIKGPAGSIYGAGNGGVISFTSGRSFTENRISSDFAVGDFGMSRYRFGIDQQLENGALSASYVRQQSDGHREHTALDRKVFQLSGTFFPSAKQTVSTQLLYADLFYELPGALTADQVGENPWQARPGSAAQNASITQKSLYGTMSHEYNFNDRFSNTTALYVNTTDFENPFNLDYKKETQYGYGGRTKFTFDDNWGRHEVRLIAGGEYQFGNTLAQNFGNRNGVADTVRFSDNLLTTQAFLFQQFEFGLNEDVLITLGLSENFSSFDIERNIDASTGEASAAKKTFEPVVLPRISVSGQLSSAAAIYGSISSGFSPPTIDEVRTNEGSINLDLEAEKGINYEIGYRAGYNQGAVNADLTLFYFQLNETITSFTNEQGVVLFRNAGATDQKGIEAMLDYAVVRNQRGFLQELKLTHAYTGHFFQFKDYRQNENDYSGNKLTGVAPHSLVNQLDLRAKPGLYLNFTHQWVDKTPLNDANTVYQDPYHLINTRLGWKRTFMANLDLEVYAGVDNLLDKLYSLGNDLNAFGGRYYQPAAPRNYFGGLKVAFRY